jgi:hypothetical protein
MMMRLHQGTGGGRACASSALAGDGIEPWKRRRQSVELEWDQTVSSKKPEMILEPKAQNSGVGCPVRVASRRPWRLWTKPAEGTSMSTRIGMLAIDLAKGGSRVWALGPDGAVRHDRALSGTWLAALLAEQPARIVAMKACATSHHWGRVAQGHGHGHEVQLVSAICVKRLVKRQRNDRAGAEAISAAARRSTMRFVAVKTSETQGRAVAFRTQQRLVRQRTQLVN